jgi:hypothetical protein
MKPVGNQSYPGKPNQQPEPSFVLSVEQSLLELCRVPPKFFNFNGL